MSIGAVCHINIADADIAKIGIQYICPVPGAGHPAIDDSFRGWLAGGNIFAIGVVGVAGIRNAVADCSSVEARVAKIILNSHIFGMIPCCRSEAVIISQRMKTLGFSFSIYQIDHVTFKVGIYIPAKQKKAAYE